MQMRVHLPHVSKIAMRLMLLELPLLDAVFDAAYRMSELELRVSWLAAGALLPVVREFEVQKGETGGCKIIAGARLCSLHNV